MRRLLLLTLPLLMTACATPGANTSRARATSERGHPCPAEQQVRTQQGHCAHVEPQPEREPPRPVDPV